MKPKIEIAQPRYVLSIRDSNARTVVELSFVIFAFAADIAVPMCYGLGDQAYNVQIYDRETKSVVFNDNTYEVIK